MIPRRLRRIACAILRISMTREEFKRGILASRRFMQRERAEKLTSRSGCPLRVKKGADRGSTRGERAPGLVTLRCYTSLHDNFLSVKLSELSKREHSTRRCTRRGFNDSLRSHIIAKNRKEAHALSRAL